MNILEELYYGNIRPSEREFTMNETCSQLLQYIARHEETLRAGLDPNQLEIFEKYRNNCQEFQQQLELNAFSNGFRLGCQLILAAMEK